MNEEGVGPTAIMTIFFMIMIVLSIIMIVYTDTHTYDNLTIESIELGDEQLIVKFNNSFIATHSTINIDEYYNYYTDHINDTIYIFATKLLLQTDYTISTKAHTIDKNITIIDLVYKPEGLWGNTPVKVIFSNGHSMIYDGKKSEEFEQYVRFKALENKQLTVEYYINPFGDTELIDIYEYEE